MLASRDANTDNNIKGMGLEIIESERAKDRQLSQLKNIKNKLSLASGMLTMITTLKEWELEIIQNEREIAKERHESTIPKKGQKGFQPVLSSREPNTKDKV